MSTTNNELFIIANRKKFRFDSTKGSITTEDLFDLNLSALDNIAVALDDKIQKLGRKSFVDKRPPSTANIVQQLDIVKFIIETKQIEDELQKQKTANSEQRAFLNDLLKKKQLEQLEGLSVDDITKQLSTLGD